MNQDVNLTGKNLREQAAAVQGTMLDVTAPKVVEVVVSNDQRVLWVNVNGVCMFRACRMESISVDVPRELKE